MTPRFLGEFEQMVLLSTLRSRGEAYALAILEELDHRAGRSVSRGSLYKTLERLEAKGFMTWTLEDGTPERGGHPRRLFRVTSRGLAALRESRLAMDRMWEGLESVMEGEGS